MFLTPILFLLVGFFFAWSWIFSRFFFSGNPLLLRQNRLRRARWQGDACLLILGSFIVLPSFLLSILLCFAPQPLTTANATPNLQSTPPAEAISDSNSESDTNSSPKSDSSPSTDSSVTGASASPKVRPQKMTHHTAFEFMTKNPSVFKFFFMLLYAAILAPILEEFVFRLLIQGWLDAREREYFRRQRGNGWRSMALTAILFSFLHYRGATSAYPSEKVLGLQFYALAVTSLFILAFGIWLLHGKLGLNRKEIGLDLSHWKEDLWTGFLAFLAAAFPTYLLQGFLAQSLKNYCAPDFLALLPIALAFGFLYWRTRRLLPGIVTHCFFNGFSVLQMLLLFLFPHPEI